MQLLMSQIMEPPPDIRAVLRPGQPVPEALSAVVMRLLEKSPSDRFQSASELAAALEAVQHLAAPTAVPTPRGREPRPIARPAEASTGPAVQPSRRPAHDEGAPLEPRSPRWLVPAAVLAACLAVGAVWWLMRDPPPAATAGRETPTAGLEDPATVAASPAVETIDDPSGGAAPREAPAPAAVVPEPVEREEPDSAPPDEAEPDLQAVAPAAEPIAEPAAAEPDPIEEAAPPAAEPPPDPAAGVRNCVTRAGQSNVQVTTTFRIAPAGSVTGVSVKGLVAGTSLAGCVERVIERLRFPGSAAPPLSGSATRSSSSSGRGGQLQPGGPAQQ